MRRLPRTDQTAGMTQQSDHSSGDTLAGLGFMMAAYAIWGALPLYMKLMSHIPAAEIVIHRIIWSVPLAALAVVVFGRTSDLREALTSPRMLGMACITAFLVSINWGAYVWAITNDQALEAALGYYINPIFSVFLGFVFLGERLTPLQWGAIALAFAAVCILTFDAGRVPLVAMLLTLSWGFYALCKRSLPIGPNQGFLLEVVILTPPALALWIYFGQTGETHFLDNLWLLLGCGIVTAFPLMLYANGAKRLRLITTAITGYIVPTLIFLVAILIFQEPFDPAKRLAFPMIWGALVLYTITLLRARHV